MKINSLEGKLRPIPYSTLLKDPQLRYIGSVQDPNFDHYVTVQLWADSKPLGVSTQTSYKYFKNSRTWNEWLELPVAIKDIPQNAQLAITVWDLSPLDVQGGKGHSIPFGGTTIPLFEQDGTLAKGRQKCKIYRHREADGSSATTTPSIPKPKRRRKGRPKAEPTPQELELERIEKLFKKHEMGEISRVDWLDQLVFRAVEKKKQEAEVAGQKHAALLKAVRSEQNAAAKATTSDGANGRENSLSDAESESESENEEHFTLYIEFPRFDFPVVFADHEYPPPKFVQPQNQSSANQNLKPPPPEVRFGPGIAGPNGLGEDDDSRVIRIYDPEQFQRDNPCETKHRRLVRSNRNGILDQDQKPNAKLRDELNEIMSYGPTQELNGEEKDLIWRFRRHLSKDKRALTKFVKSTNWSDPGEARQAVELIPRWAEIDVDDALELLGPTFDSPVVRAYAVDRLRKADDDELVLYLLQLVQALKFERISPDSENGGLDDSYLATFLVERASSNFMLGNFFHWYLMVECDDRSSESNAHRKLFAKVEYHFMLALEENHPDIRKILLRQGELITILTKISKDIKYARENRTHKIERLKRYLADPKNDLLTVSPPLPLPLDPKVLVTGVDPQDANVFKSSLSPLLINFRTSNNTKYPIIFKTGDDLRQDQLVIQIISLMDRLLRKENLDLKLTPYSILATGPIAGAVQFIPSTSLSAASAKYKGSILSYLRAHNPDDKEALGVRKETMDTYLKSCAGYCVITYILGVGDRHLENLLLAPSGHFFHIDFGFILGRDPKPFAPMMKLCKEMVEGMGGTNSPQYLQFKQYCFTAYTTLRKSSSLVLNLFSLMVNANIPDIKLEPDKAVLKVKERFHLELSEEDAVRNLETVIGDSVNAVFGVVIDRLHDFVQGWRA